MNPQTATPKTAQGTIANPVFTPEAQGQGVTVGGPSPAVGGVAASQALSPAQKIPNLLETTNDMADSELDGQSDYTTGTGSLLSNQPHSQPRQPKKPFPWRTVVLIAILLLLLAGFILTALKFYNRNKPKAPTGPVQTNSLLTVNTNQTLTVKGDLTVNGTTTLQNLLVNGSSLLQGGLTVNGDTTLNGNLNVNGNITANNFPGSGGGGTGPQGPAGPQGSAGSSTPTCTNGGCVSLQSSSPGVQETGHVNVSGNVIVGNLLPGTAGVGTAAQHSTTTISTLDNSDPDAGELATTLAIGPDGFGRVVYSGYSSNTLKFDRCTSKDCSQKISTTIATSIYAYTASMKLGSDGFARIVYTDYYGSYPIVRYIHCLDTDCTTHNDSVIEGDGLSGYYGYYTTDIEIGPDGFPRIAYDNYDDDSIHYARCTDADCTTPVITNLGVNTIYDSYQYEMDMVIGSDGFARIAAISNNDSLLHLWRCTDADCTSPVDTIVDSSNNYPGLYGVRMKLGSDNLPRIAYIDNNYYHVFYSRCGNQDCSSHATTDLGQTNVYQTDATGYGFGFDLAASDIPHFAYTDNNHAYLHQIVCSDAVCSSSSDSVVDSTYDAGYYANALALDTSGGQHFAYTEDNNYTLRYAYISPEIAPTISSGSNIGSDTQPFGHITTHELTVKTRLVTNDLQPLTPGSVSQGVYRRQLQYTDGTYGQGMVNGPDGFPRIAFVDDNYSQLWYARCTDANCTSPLITELLPHYSAYYAYAGSHIMTLGNDGFARIMYEDYNDYTLKMVRCLDADCTSKNIDTIDANGDNTPGYYGTTVTMGADGFPRIAYGRYADADNSDYTLDIYYARCTNADCTSPVTNIVGQANSYDDIINNLVLGSDGFARMVYMDYNDTTLKLARCTDADCANIVTTTVDANSGIEPGYLGSVIRLGPDGFPRIAYVDDSNEYTWYAKCNDADCTSPTITQLAQTDGRIYQSIGMDLNSAGNASIAYEANSTGYVHIIQCGDSTCTNSTDVLVDSSEDYGMSWGASLVMGPDNLPRLAYSDGRNYFIHYARLQNATGQTQITIGSAIGSSDASFGNAYLQGIHINEGLPDQPAISVNHQTSSATSLLINQINDSGNTALLADFQLNGSSVASIDNSGYLTVSGCSGCAGNSQWFYNGSEYTFIRVGIGTSNPQAQLEVVSQATNVPVAIFKAANGQSTDIMQIKDGNNNILSRFDSLGRLEVGGTSAAAIFGTSIGDPGVFGVSTFNSGVIGESTTGLGVQGSSSGFYSGIFRSSSSSNTQPTLVSRQAVGGQTADLLQLQDAIGNAVAKIDYAGNLTVNSCIGCSPAGGSSINNGTSIQTNANFAIQSAAAGSIGGVIRGASSQSADLLELQDSSGTPLVAVSSTGDISEYKTDAIFSLGTDANNKLRLKWDTGNTLADIQTLVGNAAQGALRLQTSGGSVQIASTTIGGNGKLIVGVPVTVDNSATVQFDAAGASVKGLVVQGAASQTADLLQLQSSSGTALTSIDRLGNLVLRSTGSGTLNDGAVKLTQSGYVNAYLQNFYGSIHLDLNAQALNVGGSGNVYDATGQAAQVRLDSLGISLNVASSGTAGTTINWVTALQANYDGSIQIGKIGTKTGQLYVSGSVPSATTGSIATGTNPNGVSVQGRYAYVVNNTGNSLQIFDVSNPASLTMTGSVATNDGPLSIFVSGNYAYITTRGATTGTFQIFDISNPSSPTAKSSTNVTGANGVYGVYVQGRYAYVADTGDSKFNIYDVANPSSPTLLSSTSTSAGATWSIYVQGHYAYVVNQGGGGPTSFQIFDVSNPTNPTSVGSISTGNNALPVSVYVQGRYAYVVYNNGSSNLQIFDVSNPASPTSAGTLNVGQSNAIYVQGRYAYVTVSGALRIVDVSNPASPSLVGTVGAGGALGLYVQGRYAYVTGNNTLYTFDLGGTYTQQLEAGGVETGTLQTRENLTVGNDATVVGGLTVGRTLQVSGDSGFSGNIVVSNNGTLAPWQTNANALPSGHGESSSVTANGYIYVMGGESPAGTSSTTDYYAKLNSDGSTGAWSTTTALPAGRDGHASVTANGYVYVIGGQQRGVAVQSTVYYAKLNSDGTVGSWSTTTALPGNRVFLSSVVANGYVYAIGGYDGGNAQSTVYYAKLNSNGTVGSWSTANALPAVRKGQSTVVANGYIYVIGGNDDTNPQSTVYYAKLNSDGTLGSWSTTTALTGTRQYHASVTANGYVYVIGGGDPFANNVIYYSKLNGDGTVGNWSANANAMPANRASFSYIIANGYVYIIGGLDTFTATLYNTVYYASTARVQIGGSLDLVGQQGQTLADGGDQSQGSSGGSITAGNGKFVGTLEVQGQATFSQGASFKGNLSVVGSSISEAGSASTVAQIIKGAGSQTADLLQAQDSTGAILAKIDSAGNLTVKAATINGNLTVNGHVITGNTTGSTTATINGNAGTGGSPACTVSGNDTGGQITLTTGTSAWAAGTQCTINFASSYGSAPHPVITPGSNVDTSAVKPYVTSATGSFTISFIVADTAQHTFTFNYFNTQ